MQPDALAVLLLEDCTPFAAYHFTKRSVVAGNTILFIDI